jgi:hypothetical protein
VFVGIPDAELDDAADADCPGVLAGTGSCLAASFDGGGGMAAALTLLLKRGLSQRLSLAAVMA